VDAFLLWYINCFCNLMSTAAFNRLARRKSNFYIIVFMQAKFILQTRLVRLLLDFADLLPNDFRTAMSPAIKFEG